MSRIRIAGLVAVALCSALALADNIETKKLSIKDNTNPAKRQAQVQSNDSDVSYSSAVNPAANGASLHLYSATDDLCVLLPGGASLWTNTGAIWKFKDTSTKNSARISNGKLQVKIKTEPGSGYTLMDNGSQGTVNAQVQFGLTGTKYCMKCTGNVKDDTVKFLGKDCNAAACDSEPTPCSPPTTSTSSSSTTSTSTSKTCTIPPSPRTVVLGALVKTLGKFNYDAAPSVTGANNQCNTDYPGTHACTLAQLQAASVNDLSCMQDTTNTTVTSLWAIDPTADPLTQQCHDDVFFPCTPTCPPGHTWQYGTAHTASRGEILPLDSSTGMLGTLLTGQQCNGSFNWVACCL